MMHHFGELLADKQFVVTTEIGPPKHGNPEVMHRKAELLKGCADAYNVTDNQTAVVRLSSLASCVLIQEHGMETIMQMTCRDRNRIALQSDVLGAVALGIRNFLLLTGDHQSYGNHPQAKGVFDIDSVQFVQMVRDMRDKQVFLNGESIRDTFPEVCIGAALNPFADDLEVRVQRLEKKILAGVDFVQTQSVFNLDRFFAWMDLVREQGLDSKVGIIAGVTPLKSVRMAERMKFYVPGVDVPDAVYERMKVAEDPKVEGFQIAAELVGILKKCSGVRGVHITALFWEDMIPRLVQETGLLRRAGK